MHGIGATVIEAVQKLYRLSLLALSMPVLLGEYFRTETGAEYGVDLRTKLLLVLRMVWNNVRIQTGSTFLEHLVIATKVLNVPADVEGCIVECGCYKGGSTANLSLVAGLCGRRLAVFDSFEGMPIPSERDERHTLIASEQVHTYEKGSWGATLDEVRTNINRHGDLSACEFHPGYFEETMPAFDDPVAVAFLDVGLRDSAETSVRHLWPLLLDGGHLFTHEAKHMEIAGLFYDADWWRGTLGCEPPGLIGAGNGLGLHPTSNGFTSLLAYTVKHPEVMEMEEVAETGTGENCVDPAIVRRT